MLPNTGSTIRVNFCCWRCAVFWHTLEIYTSYWGERERESEVLARNSYIPHSILASGNYGQSNKSWEKKINPGVRYVTKSVMWIWIRADPHYGRPLGSGDRRQKASNTGISQNKILENLNINFNKTFSLKLIVWNVTENKHKA